MSKSQEGYETPAKEPHNLLDITNASIEYKACYGDYGGGVLCLCCDLRLPCARLMAGDD